MTNGRRVLPVLALIAAACSSDPSTPVTSLRFVTQPAAAIAGEPTTASVELLDANGERITSAGDEVVIRTGYGDEVGEPVSVRASNGLATFDNVIVTVAGPAITLQASARQRVAVSLPFPVVAGAPDGATSDVEIPDGELFTDTPTAVNVRVRDRFANPITRKAVSMVPGGGVTWSPVSGFTDDDGVFATTMNVGNVGNAVVTATVAGANITVGEPVEVSDACTVISLEVPGSASSTLVEGTGCLVGGFSTRRYSFATTTLGGVLFTLAPTFTAAFEVRKNFTQAGLNFLTDAEGTAEWLLPAGTYELLVSSRDGSGGFTVTAATGPGNTGNVLRALLVPGAYSQSLGGSDFFDGDWYTDFFLVSSPVPCTIAMQSPTIDSFLILNNAVTGDIISGERVDGGPGGIESVRRTACQSIGQPILINATTTLPGETGAYTLTLELDGPAAIRAGSAALLSPSLPHGRLLSPRELMRINASVRTRR